MPKADSQNTTATPTPRNLNGEVLAPTTGHFNAAGIDDPRVRDPGVYALIVAGSCMEPFAFEGDLVLVTPNERPKHGDTVAIWWKDKTKEPLLKRLVSLPPPSMMTVHPNSDCMPLVQVAMLRPPMVGNIAVDKIAAVHLVFKVVRKAKAVVEDAA